MAVPPSSEHAQLLHGLGVLISHSAESAPPPAAADDVDTVTGFLHYWQTLVGIIAGGVGGVIITGAGFLWTNGKKEAKAEQHETDICGLRVDVDELKAKAAKAAHHETDISKIIVDVDTLKTRFGAIEVAIAELPKRYELDGIRALIDQGFSRLDDRLDAFILKHPYTQPRPE